ncbi:MAG: von Willebrand factor type A domain-containing protein [Oscillospiraceae bacterium]|nr:von Willebrand factor type A domain-containing protein [Oscillospiraceae bacterium]
MKFKRKEKIFLTAFAVFLLCIPMVTAMNSQKQTEILTAEGIISGYPDGEMHLENNVTRAEFTKMLIDTLDKCGKPDPQTDIPEPKFDDVDESHWAYGYIVKAVKSGIVNGIDKNTFAPDNNITYEQAAKMVISAFEYTYGLDYPFGYISEAIDEGYLYGVSAISGEYITREDAVNLFYNAYEKAKIRAEYEDSYMGRGGLSSGGGGGSYIQNSASKMLQAESAAAPAAEQSMSGLSFDAAAYGSSSGTAAMPPAFYPRRFNTEEYTSESENIFKNVSVSPLSTFSIDVDTASYSNARRFIFNGRIPADGSVRTEEMINYFDYDYPRPDNGEPFSITTEIADCPWNENNKLALIALKGDEISDEERKPCNLVFLIDISGSMYSANKLPLVQRSLSMMLEKLDSRDKISIVTYASGTGVALAGESADNADKIKKTLYSLTAGGGTAGSDGINLAYKLAEENKIDGNNRIILCTDGDFNIGASSTAELERLIEEKRDKGIYLSVLGFGMGNYKDNRMETLADKGNGNYAYIDNVKEAKKVLVDEMTKTIYTIAKDVKIQVEFNPEKVKEYRLVGYENRALENEDFENDAKDAGELGAGSTVTALYEIVPADGTDNESPLRYQTKENTGSDEYMFVKLRYKDPDGSESKLIEKAVASQTGKPSNNFKFAAAVAEFSMLLNNSEFKGTSSADGIIALADESRGEDKFGLRAEFIQIVDLYKYIENSAAQRNIDEMLKEYYD